MHAGNYRIKKGCTIAVYIYRLHRDKRYFPEPDLFKPERFSPENGENRPPYAYIPFSAGKRNCIGQRYAMMELKVVMANLLKNFNLECSQTTDEIKPTATILLTHGENIMFKINPRNN